ncbi:MAG: ECF-type sigma factor [Planctomycetota bacterium]|jgi:RNA polymerase sigma factor (TIGR02999 family)
MAEITLLLERVRSGEEEAASELFAELYGQLHGLAAAIFHSQRGNHTLQPTALVHETYLKMIRPGATPWQDRAHFCGVAAKAMRQILVNHARDKQALKRGGAAGRVTLSDAAREGGPDLDVLAIHEALEELGQLDARQARIAELRFFAGLNTQEVAEVVGVAPRTVELDWRMAKDWLAQRL